MSRDYIDIRVLLKGTEIKQCPGITTISGDYKNVQGLQQYPGIASMF